MGKRIKELRDRVKKLERQVAELLQAGEKAKGSKGHKKPSKTKAPAKKAPSRPLVARTLTHGKSKVRPHVKQAEKAIPVAAPADEETTA